MAASTRSTGAGTRSQTGRLRLIVIQALVFSLFATLFARLYYLQVVSGDEYHAQAASQSVREIVVQPQRGLIVDDQGRPLVANRTVVGDLGRPDPARQDDRATSRRVLVERVGRRRSTVPRRADPQAAGHLRRRRQRRRAAAGTARRTSRSRSPRDVRRAGRAADPRAARGLPGRARRAADACAPTRARTASTLAHVLGYLSPITEDEYDPADDERRPLGQRRLVGRPRRRREGVRRAGCAACPATAGSRSTRWAGCSATTARSPASPATPWSPRSTPRCRASSSSSSHETIATARQTLDTVTGRNYVADSGAAVVMEADTGRIVAMASQPTYDPEVWVGGITKKQLARLYSEKAGTPLLGRATQGQFAPGLDVEAVHDRRRADQRLHAPTPSSNCSSGVPGRQPGLQELRVRRLRLHRLRQGARGLLQHLLLPGRLRLLAAVRLRRRRRERPDPLVEEAKDVRLRQPRPASTCRARRPAGSPTGSGSAPTTSR